MLKRCLLDLNSVGTSLPEKKLLARVIADKERAEEDGALPRKLTERIDYIPSVVF